MNYEKYEADREAAAAAFEEVKAVFSERIAQLISSIYAVVSERIPQFIISVMEFITAIIRRDKAYFGIKSPSVEFARNFAGIGYGFMCGIQQAKLEQIERVFAPYEISGTIRAPEYKPIADVVAAFKYVKHEYEWYFD